MIRRRPPISDCLIASHARLSTPGRLAAAFLSSSLAMIVLGGLVYCRNDLRSVLNVYPPASVFSGVWLYSYAIWLLLWVGLDRVLRRRETVWTLPGWISLFLGVTLFTIVFMQFRVEWHTLFQ
jgi:hypothetical protein